MTLYDLFRINEFNFLKIESFIKGNNCLIIIFKLNDGIKFIVDYNSR